MNSWILGARPRTLPAAVVPVAIGAGCAVGAGSVVWWRVAVALVVSLALQVGVNYANDYSDGVRGTDDRRVGPVRLVASGLQPPARREAGGVRWPSVSPPSAGLALAATTSWWLLVVGAAAIAAAWGYTGGPRPYGYAGLGELFVFVFFGLVATVGTTYVAVERVTGLAVLMGCAAGCLACALLVVNNLRDIPSDTAAGKRTLAVRLGDARTRQLYLALLVAAYVLVVVAAWTRPWVLLALASAPARRAAGPRRAGRRPRPGADPRARRAPAACSWRSAPWPRSASSSAPAPAPDRASGGQVGGEPGVEGGEEGVGAFEVGGVAGAVDDRQGGVGEQRRPSARRRRRTWRRAAPATRSTGIVSAGRRVPQRLLGAGAGEPQARRQAGGRVAAAVVEPGLGQRGEQRLGDPAVEEGVDAVALDRRRQLRRRSPAAPPARRRRRCRPWR